MDTSLTRAALWRFIHRKRDWRRGSLEKDDAMNRPRTYVIPIFLLIFFIVGWFVQRSPCGGACAR